jgi:uncharacterized membrane protein YcjF (UPF0283 family)
MASDDSSSGRFAARIEEFVFGRGRRWYRWFVRIVVLLLVVVLVLDVVWVVTDVLGTSVFSPAITGGLRVLTAALFTLFLLTGLVQFLVLGRVFERGTAEVAQSADELEKTAEEVTEAASEVEELSETVAGPESDEMSDDVKEQTDEIKGEMENVERTASEVKDKLDAQRERGPDEPDESGER